MKKKAPDTTIVVNRKATHDYYIEDSFEAGLCLQGWEVKSLRAKKAQLVDSYVLIKDGEAFLLGCHITPLQTASSHVVAHRNRTRKLLLNKRTVETRSGEQQKANLRLHPPLLADHLVKCRIAPRAREEDHDKRASHQGPRVEYRQQRIVRQANRRQR